MTAETAKDHQPKRRVSEASTASTESKKERKRSPSTAASSPASTESTAPSTSSSSDCQADNAGKAESSCTSTAERAFGSDAPPSKLWVKQPEGFLDKFWRTEVVPFLELIAWCCNLKYYQDLRTFLIVGIYFGLVFLRWNLYEAQHYESGTGCLVSRASYVGSIFGGMPLVNSVLGGVGANGGGLFCYDGGFSGTWWFRCFDVWWQGTCCVHCFYTATIVHNCIHFSQFKNYHMNTLWHIILTHSYGHAVSTLIPGHNLSHHKYVQTPKDVMRTTRMRWRYNLLNCIFFAASITPNTSSQDAKYFRIALEKGNWPTFYRMRVEQLTYYPLQVYLAYYFFSKWYWVIFFPQLFGKLGIITMNLLQHDGCLVLRELGETPDPYIAIGSQTNVENRGKEFTEQTIFEEKTAPLEKDSSIESSTQGESDEEGKQIRKRKKKAPATQEDVVATAATESDGTGKDKLWDPDFNFARDFVGGYVNFWTCNNGYHTIHHLRPSMHWTKYPAMSEKLVKPYQHPELRQRNLLLYSINTFLFGQRRTWDGRPYFPNEPNYDVDWVDIFFKMHNPFREN